MGQKSGNIIRSKSKINYSYATIKITQSRIDKGLIAIPVALAERFPDHNETIQIYLNDSPTSQTKNFSSYNSSTRECRIGGLKQWFQQNDIRSGDEIVIKFIDKERFNYRLIPERNFVLQTRDLQHSFDISETEQEASDKITNLSQWIQINKDEVVFNEYYRLANTLPTRERKYVRKSTDRARESIPYNLRALLRDIYKGHCQVCNFWFLKKDKIPYFEVHHLDPLSGHHLKNIVVVCGNCHNQFEHANVKKEFNDDSWLIRVSFNENIHEVEQAIFNRKIEGFFKELFI